MPARETSGGRCVPVHQQADDDRAGQQHIREIVGAQIGNEFGTGQRLEDVVGGHRQEGVGEHQQGDGAVALPQGHDPLRQAA